jgi:hypothetical protein
MMNFTLALPGKTSKNPIKRDGKRRNMILIAA